MGRIAYYLLIKPLSLLPLRVSFLLSDLLFFTLYYLTRYRRKVVFANLRNSFPEKSPKEIETIARKFYSHMCDLMLEFIRIFSISEKELVRRCKIRNPELLEQIYREGKSVIIAAGHYNNWELAAVAFDLQASHQAVGIYKPLGNAYLDGKPLPGRQEKAHEEGTGAAGKRSPGQAGEGFRGGARRRPRHHCRMGE